MNPCKWKSVLEKCVLPYLGEYPFKDKKGLIIVDVCRHEEARKVALQKNYFGHTIKKFFWKGIKYDEMRVTIFL